MTDLHRAPRPILQASAPGREMRCANFALPSFVKVFMLTHESTFQKLVLIIPFKEEKKWSSLDTSSNTSLWNMYIKIYIFDLWNKVFLSHPWTLQSLLLPLYLSLALWSWKHTQQESAWIWGRRVVWFCFPWRRLLSYPVVCAHTNFSNFHIFFFPVLPLFYVLSV